ncbi:hypothetical protein [Paenibacillus senegalensis]|uniref:hypothetical protein n=1 Tax=Paenibacillus senegalensis TaxID=1465766 RepID=UPI000288BD8B|nr:hypothetical protein [Paenibacillus senegalensis]
MANDKALKSRIATLQERIGSAKTADVIEIKLRANKPEDDYFFIDASDALRSAIIKAAKDEIDYLNYLFSVKGAGDNARD